MKKIALLLAFLAVVGLAQGRGYGGFVVSYMMPDLEGLNQRLSDQGLPEIDEQVLTFGGGGWGGSKVMVGGWGFGGTQKVENEDITVKVSYAGGFFDPGYFINIYKGFGIKPSLGIGGTSVTLDLRPVLGDIEFDSLLVDPGRTTRVTYASFSLAPTLSILVPIKFVALELKGGYIWSPAQGEWELDDGTQVRLGPQVSTSGPYASASILFGGSG